MNKTVDNISMNKTVPMDNKNHISMHDKTQMILLVILIFLVVSLVVSVIYMTVAVTSAIRETVCTIYTEKVDGIVSAAYNKVFGSSKIGEFVDVAIDRKIVHNIGPGTTISQFVSDFMDGKRDEVKTVMQQCVESNLNVDGSISTYTDDKYVKKIDIVPLITNNIHASAMNGELSVMVHDLAEGLETYIETYIEDTRTVQVAP